jgi:hypothetical protein
VRPICDTRISWRQQSSLRQQTLPGGELLKKVNQALSGGSKTAGIGI